MNTYYGADISRWQGTVDWPAFNPGAAFVFFKAGGGDGGNYIDSQFENNLAGSRALGNQMPHGVYWFLQGDDPVGEANYFIQNVGNRLQTGEVIVLDCETSSGVNPNNAKQWLDTVSSVLGFKPIVYMSDNTVLTHDWSAVANANYGLWVADWGVDTSNNVPLKYWPFYAFQQYKDNGTFPGISGNVDADAFFADAISDFYKYGKPANVPPPIETPAPVQPPVIPVPPVPEPTPVPPVPEPIPEPVPPIPDPTPPKQGIISKVIQTIINFINWLLFKK